MPRLLKKPHHPPCRGLSRERGGTAPSRRYHSATTWRCALERKGDAPSLDQPAPPTRAWGVLGSHRLHPPLTDRGGGGREPSGGTCGRSRPTPNGRLPSGSDDARAGSRRATQHRPVPPIPLVPAPTPPSQRPPQTASSTFVPPSTEPPPPTDARSPLSPPPVPRPPLHQAAPTRAPTPPTGARLQSHSRGCGHTSRRARGTRSTQARSGMTRRPAPRTRHVCGVCWSGRDP